MGIKKILLETLFFLKRSQAKLELQDRGTNINLTGPAKNLSPLCTQQTPLISHGHAASVSQRVA
jgi:hypothetical protein